MFPDKIPHKIGYPERRSARNEQRFHSRDCSGLINLLHMLQQIAYNLVDARFSQGKPCVTPPEASVDLIRVIEEKLNQPCTLFEITFLNQSRCKPAQYMLEPGTGQTTHTVNF